MNRSIEGVVTFLQNNDSLIKQLMETAESATTDIEQLATQVDHARDEAQSTGRSVRGRRICGLPSG